VANNKTEKKVSDKTRYWRIASTGWVIFAYCFLASMWEWAGMVGVKALLFSGLSLAISGTMTVLAVRCQEPGKPDIPPDDKAESSQSTS